MFSRLPGFTLLTLCLATAFPAHARDAAPPSEKDFLGDLPVVLSVSRLSQPQSEAPGSVSVIDAETIRLSGARDVADLFRLLPGFQVGRSGGNPRVYYHGALETYGQHMQVLVDGRSAYSPFYLGGVKWNDLMVSLEDIERIEVLRGSNSAAFGSDAFLGVANIITKHPSQTTGWTLSQKGGGGVRDTLVRWGQGDGTLDWRVSLNKQSDAGFDLIPSGRDLDHLTVRADWRANLRDEFQFQLGANRTQTDAGYPNVNGNHNGDMPRRQEGSSHFLMAKWQRTFSPEENFRLSYYRSVEQNKDRFLYGDPLVPDVWIDYGGYSRRDDLEAQHTFSPRSDMRVVWGGQARRDGVQSLPLYGKEDELSMVLLRLFGNLEWRISPKAVLNLGTSVEKVSLTGTSNAPRAMLSYHLTPDQTLRVGATKSTRAPSIFEQKSNVGYFTWGGLARQRFLGAGRLQTEDILSREIGWLGHFREVGIKADVRLFHERIQGLASPYTYDAPFTLTKPVLDWIAHYYPRYPAAAVARALGLGPFNRPKDFENGDDNPSVRGIEWQVEYTPVAGTRVNLNQSFLRIASRSPLPSDFGPGTRDVAPTHSTSIALYQKLPRDMDLSVMFYSVGAMYWTGQPEPKVISGYRRVDARLSAPFRMGQSRAEISLTGQNLTGSYDETDVYFPMGRRILLEARLQF